MTPPDKLEIAYGDTKHEYVRADAVRKLLKGLPESELLGEGGLCAGTMRALESHGSAHNDNPEPRWLLFFDDGGVCEHYTCEVAARRRFDAAGLTYSVHLFQLAQSHH